MVSRILCIPSIKLCPMTMVAIALSWLLCSCSPPPRGTGKSSISVAAVVSPGQEGGGSPITATFRDTITPATFKDLRVLINTDIDGRRACYIYFDPAANLLSLTKDSGEGAEPIPIGTLGSVSNSQCRLDSQVSSLSKSEVTYTLTLGLAFLPTFAGKKNVYLYAEAANGASTGFVKAMEWEVR
jgi:hypothetical protein